jgi:hypothetical protein
MLKCNICGKAGNYTQMIDYTVYSVHPQCEAKMNNIAITNSKSIYDMQNKVGGISDLIMLRRTTKSESELREHLMNQHTKESLIDRMLNLDKDSF